MIGIDIDRDAWPVMEAALALAAPALVGADTPGLLIISAGQKTLRLLPPYTISDSEIDQGLEMLQKLLRG
jgi:4-aminobutyrate aminotransferase-like enzyme